MTVSRYDTIGIDYNRNRIADNRITQIIESLLLLPPQSLIADIGAGTGNYSNALAEDGYRVLAVEPSAVMQRQALSHEKVEWIYGEAESIPLMNNSVDGVIAILSIHHFTSVWKAADEFHRICPIGPLVIFTYDPRECRDFWINEYFPEIYKREFDTFPTLARIAELLSAGKRKWSIHKFPLPLDLSDRNMHSGWNRPEIYLDEQMRNNTSGFALAESSVVQHGIKRLTNDLKSGAWDAKYGYLREQTSLDTGFRFIRISD